MKQAITLIIFTLSVNALANPCPPPILGINIENKSVQSAQKDCLETIENEDESCACVNELAFPVSNEKSFSPFIEDKIYSENIEQAKIAISVIAEEIKSYSASPFAQGNNNTDNISKSCNLRDITTFKCESDDPLLDNKESLDELVNSFRNTISNHYKSSNYLKPDIIPNRGCSIPDSVVSKLRLDTDIIRLNTLKDIVLSVATKDDIESSKSLSELIIKVEDSDELSDDEFEQIYILNSELQSIPILNKIIKSTNNYKSLVDKNNNGLLQVFKDEESKKEIETKIIEKCADTTKKVQALLCVDKSKIAIPFKNFKETSLLKLREPTYSIQSNNQDIKLYCSRKIGIDQNATEVKSLSDILPSNFKIGRNQTNKEFITKKYDDKILKNKISTTLKDDNTLALCDYIPQPSNGKGYNENGVEQAIEKNCKLGEHHFRCIQARLVKANYGPKLEKIQELEDKISILSKEKGSIITVEFNGEVISLQDAEAKRELLVKNLFSEDQKPPQVVSDFLGIQKIPSPVATNENKEEKKSSSQSSTKKLSGSTPTTRNSSVANSPIQETTGSIAGQIPGPAQFSQNNGTISQAQRNANTQKVLNGLDRFRREKTQNENSRFAKSNSAQSSRGLSNFNREALDQLTSSSTQNSSPTFSADSNDTYSLNDYNQDSSTSNFTDQVASNDGLEYKKTDEEEKNDALGAKYRAEAKAKAKSKQRSSVSTKGGRSIASTGNGASSGATPKVNGSSGVKITKGSKEADEFFGNKTESVIEINSDFLNENYADLIELVEIDPAATSSLIDFIKDEEIPTFKVKQGSHEVLIIKKPDGSFVVSTDGGNTSDREYVKFYTKIRKTFLFDNNTESISSKKDEIIARLESFQESEALSDISNL